MVFSFFYFVFIFKRDSGDDVIITGTKGFTSNKDKEKEKRKQSPLQSRTPSMPPFTTATPSPTPSTHSSMPSMTSDSVSSISSTISSMTPVTPASQATSISFASSNKSSGKSKSQKYRPNKAKARERMINSFAPKPHTSQYYRKYSNRYRDSDGIEHGGISLSPNSRLGVEQGGYGVMSFSIIDGLNSASIGGYSNDNGNNVTNDGKTLFGSAFETRETDASGDSAKSIFTSICGGYKSAINVKNVDEIRDMIEPEKGKDTQKKEKHDDDLPM